MKQLWEVAAALRGRARAHALRDSAGWVPMGLAGRVLAAIDKWSVGQDREHMLRLLTSTDSLRQPESAERKKKSSAPLLIPLVA